MVATMVTHMHLKTYRLALIADAHARAVERRTPRNEINMAEITELSETQIGILDKGMRYETFALTRAEAGKAADNMKTRGLIKKTSIQGRWTMTPEGRAEHERIKAAKTAAADITVEGLAPSPINLDDPALGAKDPVLQRWMTLADERQVTIKNLNRSLDDMGRLADDLAKKVKTLETDQAATTRIEDTADTTARIIVEALLKMKTEDDSHLTLIAYVDDLRQKAATVDQAAMAVEALRRQLDQAHLDLHIAERHAALHEMDEFLVCVLDELAQADPLIKEHRDSRVKAQRALTQIKDRR